MGRLLIETPTQVSNVVSVKVSSLCITWGGRGRTIFGEDCTVHGLREDGKGVIRHKQIVKGSLWKIDRQ